MKEKASIKRTLRFTKHEDEMLNKIINLKKLLGEKTCFSKLSRMIIMKEVQHLNKQYEQLSRRSDNK